MTATALPFAPAPPRDPGPPPAPPQPGLAMTLASHLQLGIITDDRSLQTAVGASEVGHPCARRLAYRLAGAPVSNHGDPTRLLVGTGTHLAIENILLRADRGAGRFLTELPVTYRGIPGRVDLLDTFLHVVVDWKTTGKARLSGYAKDGIPQAYRVQAQIYAAGLREAGYQIHRLAVAFLPYDGALSQLWTWEADPDPAEADRAIDRLDALRGLDPATVTPTPDRLCSHCPYHNPRATDLAVGCPGTAPKGNTSS